MKILMVIQLKSERNPFVSSLVDGLIKIGNQVVCGLDYFWNSYYDYELIYFQWPESIFEWQKNKIDLKKLADHFDIINKAHIKTIITCHNLHPHNNDTKTTELYELVYSRVDAFHHLGNFSYQIMKRKYPNKYHFIAPHHVADSLRKTSFSSNEAKKKLHIPSNNIVISSFGAFRNNEEVRLFVDMVNDVSDSDLSFLAPRIRLGYLDNGRHIDKTIKYIYNCLFYKIKGIKYSGFLSNEDLGTWLSASDIIFIQRKEILNSGNIPLAFSAGKVVVGPNLGNVGEILEETGNYLFDPNDRASIKKAVVDAIKNVKKSNQLGLNNYNYAKDNWSTVRVCEIINSQISYIKGYLNNRDRLPQ